MRDTQRAGELLDGSSELPVMSFDVGKGQWFQLKLAGTMQVVVVAIQLVHFQLLEPPLQ